VLAQIWDERPTSALFCRRRFTVVYNGQVTLRAVFRRVTEAPMEERDFYDERQETRSTNLTCPHCRQAAEYELGWSVRTKKTQIANRADERDRARFAKFRSYMVRRDDLVGCKNVRCRKRFEVTGVQSVAFLD
jgi:hypothetical protein